MIPSTILPILLMILLSTQASINFQDSDMWGAELTSEESPSVFEENFSASRCKEVVAEFNGLIDGLELPGHLMKEDAEKTDRDFDVNLYFTVLDRLSMEPGYVLDYVYFYIDDFAGGPYLYARRADEPPYKNYDEFSDAGGGANLSEREDYYPHHIVADGSPESFFQLSLLRIQGDQFYLFWHANYNDARIVCDHDDANATLADLGSRYLSTEEILPNVGEIDFSPVVLMDEDQVQVDVVIFTKWGGFIRDSVTMKREFPHEILYAEAEVLVPYNCGIIF
jgi:hypothetical protein